MSTGNKTDANALLAKLPNVEPCTHLDSVNQQEMSCMRHHVIGDLWECYCKYAGNCKHALHFGHGYYCKNPESPASEV